MRYIGYIMKYRNTKSYSKRRGREVIRTSKHGQRTKSTKIKKVGDVVRLFNKRDEIGIIKECYEDYIIVEWFNSMDKVRHKHCDVFID